MEKKTKVVAGTSLGVAALTTLFFGAKAIQYFKAKQNTKKYVNESFMEEEIEEEIPQKKYIKLNTKSFKYTKPD